MFEIYDGKQDFTQWDINQKLIVKDQTIKEVHFNNALSANALICVPYELDGLLVVNVPNILLQEALRLYVYAFCGECVRASADYEVKPRVKPSDYVYTETEVKGYAALDNRLTEVEELTAAANEVLEDTVKEVAANVEQLWALNLAIRDKADKEEWITIADTKLTEDVASLEFTTDINGNPFRCKRIIFRCYINTGLQNEQSWRICFPHTTSNATLAYSYINVAKNCYGCLIDSTIIKEGELIHHSANGYSAATVQSSQEILKYATDANYFTKYGVYTQQNMSMHYYFPAGADIKVWGLKA